MIGLADARRERWRVLVFPGGTEIALEIRQALAPCKEVLLFSAGADVSSHAPFVFAHHSVVPFVGDRDWVGALQTLIARERITHVFPAHDDAVLALAEQAPLIGAKVVTSPVETCRVARSKRETADRLRHVVPTPIMFPAPGDVTGFPVFVKPDRGQGAHGAAVARTARELELLLDQDPTRTIFEFLPGAEYTVDCFSDRDRGLLFAGGRKRRRVRAGISMDSIPVEDARFADFAARIGAELPMHGGWFFQLKADAAGVLKVLEIAPRVAGTSGLTRARGVNLPLLSLYESERIPVVVRAADYSVEIDRALTNRYRHSLVYRTLYVDFDDTLIIRGQMNVELIKLLYQALNRGVRLVLITRHAGDIRQALLAHRVGALFDEVIHLREGECKASVIRDRDAVLIDDSFAERDAVQQQLGIPVFDSAAIEVLFDDRV